ncbi:hypothetical protein PTKIN_Ptkin06aG0191000 [Pterospermum kingtungense]
MASLSLQLSSLHHTSTTPLITRATPLKQRAQTQKPFSIRSQSVPVLSQDDLKKLAADKAVESVKSGMVLGLGTGSTAAFVVDKLGQLLSTGQLSNIIGVPTSKRTQEQAASLNIPLSTLNNHPHIDIAIDGADEVDPNLDLVKGRGGALLREKMVEAASSSFIVVADDSKLVSGLGGSGLAMPVEVVQFCWNLYLMFEGILICVGGNLLQSFWICRVIVECGIIGVFGNEIELVNDYEVFMILAIVYFSSHVRLWLSLKFFSCVCLWHHYAVCYLMFEVLCGADLLRKFGF